MCLENEKLYADTNVRLLKVWQRGRKNVCDDTNYESNTAEVFIHSTIIF